MADAVFHTLLGTLCLGEQLHGLRAVCNGKVNPVFVGTDFIDLHDGTPFFRSIYGFWTQLIPTFFVIFKPGSLTASGAMP